MHGRLHRLRPIQKAPLLAVVSRTLVGQDADCIVNENVIPVRQRLWSSVRLHRQIHKSRSIGSFAVYNMSPHMKVRVLLYLLIGLLLIAVFNVITYSKGFASTDRE